MRAGVKGIYISKWMEHSNWGLSECSFHLCKKSFPKWNQKFLPCFMYTGHSLHQERNSRPPIHFSWVGPVASFHRQNTAEQPGSLLDFPAQPRQQLHYKTSPPVPTLNSTQAKEPSYRKHITSLKWGQESLQHSLIYGYIMDAKCFQD